MNVTDTVTNGGPQTQQKNTGPVWVQCPGFRCLAYLDEDGKWRTVFNNEILTRVLVICDITA